MSRVYNYISADSHLEVIAPEAWTKWVPERFRDRAPRRINLPEGGYYVLAEGQPLMTNNGMSLYAGHTPANYRPEDPKRDGEAGSGSPESRLRELDLDGVDAEVLYSLGRGLLRGIRARDAYLAVLRGYNEWLAAEYCAVAPDRLIGLGMMPDTTVDDNIAELEHSKRIGLKGIDLGSYPSGLKYPTPEDDRFWAAAIDLEMPVTVHIAFEGVRTPPTYKYAKTPQGDQWLHTDPVERITRFARAGGVNATQMVAAGVFDRFPKFRIFFAENQVGWIPCWLEQMDNNYYKNAYWGERLYGLPRLKRLPSEYIKEHCYWGFMYDPIGVKLRHEIGVDKLLWSTDFPHIESDWPQSRAFADRMFADVPEDERYRMTARNTIEFFHLDAANAETPAAAASGASN